MRISRRHLLQLGVAGTVGASLSSAACDSSSPAAPSSTAAAASTSASTPIAAATTVASSVPDATFVRIPANPSFVFASGGTAEPIATDYCLSQLLVTNDDYLAYVLASGARAPRHWVGGSPPAGKGAHPVLWISLTDAEAYCASYDALIAEGGFTTPVGSYPAGRSSYGCLDMAGNAYEWTSSLVIEFRLQRSTVPSRLSAWGTRMSASPLPERADPILRR